MGSKLYDPIRQKWVVANDEEILRQRILKWMLEKGHYPRGLISVELAIFAQSNTMGNTSVRTKKSRRYDILSYIKENDGSLAPALLIECKAKLTTEEQYLAALLQLQGYRAHINPKCIALVSSERSFYQWSENSQWFNGLPTYTELLHNAH